MPVTAIQYESHQPPLYYLLAVPFYVLERDATLDSRLFGLRLYSALWGAVLLALVSDVTRVMAQMQGLSLVLYGGLLVVIIAFLPNGLIHLFKRRRPAPPVVSAAQELR